VGVIAERQDIEALFASLAANHVEEFLAGCSDQLLVTVRGSGPLTSTVSPDRLPQWWRGFHHLTEHTLATEVLLVLTEVRSHVVILRHRFTRGGRERAFDTVNICTLRDGALAAWFSSPLDRQEYVEAWGLPRREDQPTGTFAGSRPSSPRMAIDLERR
jgi:hypothetical protein